jgi:hypothetical protein
MAESLYGPMVDVLQGAFGVEFEFWDTGGGCNALVGEFEGDTTVYITDAPGARCGQECQITDHPLRVRHGEATVGFAVGVYRDDHQTSVAYGEYPAACTRHLPVIVAEQLTAALGRQVTVNWLGLCGDLDPRDPVAGYLNEHACMLKTPHHDEHRSGSGRTWPHAPTTTR